MKKFWLLFAGLIWPYTAMAAAEAPFAPLPNVPDYVATIFVKLSHGPTHRDIRTHRAGWTRVDGSFDQRYYRSTAYFGPGPVSVLLAREPSAEIEGHDWLHIMRGPVADRGVDRRGDPVKTGERQTFLGESCEIWNMSSHLIRPEAKQLSCLTPDGIELWSRVDNDVLPGRSIEVTAVKRQPVTPAEVQPPVDRLDLKSWLTMPSEAARPSDAPDDVTVVMQGQLQGSGDRQIQTRTVRRHYPWTYTEDLYGNGRRRLKFSNETERLDIMFEKNAAGEATRLSVNKALRKFDRHKPPETGPTETILGERCIRFENSHRHGRSSRCRTADGLMLQESSSDLEERYDLIAVKLDRGPVNLDAVLPPPFIFTRATWGIPD